MIIEREISKILVKVGLGTLYVSKTKKSAFLKLLFALILIFFSYKLLLTTIYQTGLKVILMVILMFLIFIGAITATSAIFKLIFNLQAVDEHGNTISAELQKTDSIPLIIYWVLIFSFLAVPFKGCSDERERLKDEQLRLYGKTQKVKIVEIYKRPKSSKKARFHIENKGQIIEESLEARDFKEGDETFVTFSTENTKIILWTDERQKELKDQLRDHYKWQRIIINDIFIHPKLGKRAKFTYENYEDYYESHLPAKDHKVGDTVEIIFSKENTNIMGWSYNEAIEY